MSDEVIIKPKIDDAYWFDYSQKLVDGAVTTRDKMAENFQKLVIWLWGIYTATAAVGFALSEKALSFWPTFLIASASALLIAVYWCSIWIQIPIQVEFDPRSPTEINKTHKDIVATKDKRIKFTLILSILAAIMVSLSIIFASVSKKQKTIEPGFEASIHPTDEGRMLALTGVVGKVDTVTIYVRPILTDSTFGKTRTFFFTPTEEGLIQTSILVSAIKADTSNLDVTLQWVDPKRMKIQLSTVVKNKPNNKSSK